MLKTEKERIVAELVERLRTSSTLIVADYRGLDMSAIDDVRTELVKHGARFSVVKNTLTRRAAEAAGVEELNAFLEGPTAIAFVGDGDMVAVAKALNESARTTRILTLKGGILEGRPMTADDVRELASLPPMDVLRGQVLGAVVAPLNAIAGLVNAPLQNLYGLLDARIDQLREQGDTSDAGVAPADAVDTSAAEDAPAAPEAVEEEAAKPAAEAGGPGETTEEPTEQTTEETTEETTDQTDQEEE
jgi:large subunit ribosomal protein L10